MIVNRLTVDGKDYFLPEPVDELKGQILAAVRAGGDYVNIPPINSGSGIDILFSPGMPILWTQLDIRSENAAVPGLAYGVDDANDLTHGVDEFE